MTQIPAQRSLVASLGLTVLTPQPPFLSLATFAQTSRHHLLSRSWPVCCWFVPPIFFSSLSPNVPSIRPPLPTLYKIKFHPHHTQRWHFLYAYSALFCFLVFTIITKQLILLTYLVYCLILPLEWKYHEDKEYCLFFFFYAQSLLSRTVTDI